MAVAPPGTRATQYRKLRKALTNPPGIMATQALLGQVVTLGSGSGATGIGGHSFQGGSGSSGGDNGSGIQGGGGTGSSD